MAETESLPEAPVAPPVAPVAPAKSSRLLSLDALRGFDMFWIMGADSLGGAMATMASGPITRAVADQLEHVPWEGFHFEDLIFPLFVFMAGVSLVFSLGKIIPRYGKDAAFARLMKRTLLLYLLGIFYYGGFSTSFDRIRLLGVLQRIALCYGVTGSLFIFFRLQTLLGIAVAILLSYWALLALVPVPGHGPASFLEGKNFVNWFDSSFLPLRKLDGDHDPEGILSTIPAIVSCLLGVFAGKFLANPKQTPAQKAKGLVIAGALLVMLGLGWGQFFPIIKKLWTSTFVLVAGGCSSLLLGAFYWIVDVQGWRRWCEPFVWVGLNPIAIYLASELVDFGQLASRLAGGNVQALLDQTFTKGFGALVQSLLALLFAFALARFLHQRKVYLRL